MWEGHIVGEFVVCNTQGLGLGGTEMYYIQYDKESWKGVRLGVAIWRQKLFIFQTE